MATVVTTPTTPPRVLVVGAGLMGTGIAHAFLVSGCRVALVDIRADAVEAAVVAIGNTLDDGVKRGKLMSSESTEARARLTTYTDLATALGDNPIELLIETVTESIAAKTTLAREADRLLAPHAIIATNTSALSVSEIAAATQRPDRVVGMHFFNPVPKMKLVEIVRGMATNDSTVQRVRDWAELIGKRSILVEESPGLTTSRMSALAGNEAMYMLMEGIASAEDIDTAMRGAFNHPMGPLELGDLTGWDTRLSVLQYLHQTLGDRFRPCPLIIKMVKAGRLGRKTGHGVYRYVDGQRVPGSAMARD